MLRGDPIEREANHSSSLIDLYLLLGLGLVFPVIARTDALIAEKTRNSSHRKKEPVRPVRELKEVEVLVKAHG